MPRLSNCTDRGSITLLLLGVVTILTACDSSAPPSMQSPLSPAEQLKTFTLPKGYEIELVASDPEIAKLVNIVFDDAGRMWTATATEYPFDAIDDPRVRERWERPGRDRVLVFDTPTLPGRQTPRTYADGMVMPMTIQPISNGVLVAQGPYVFFMQDSDGDGKADRKEVLLSGFGVEDSHTLVHCFFRGPGEWIYFAQGGLPQSRVKTPDDKIVEINNSKVVRMKEDGTNLEIYSYGLNNLWGFVIDRYGEMWSEEASDLGYPLVPIYHGASYPGIGNHKARPYSPWQPPIADFSLGGTGLCGLAHSENLQGFPPPFRGAMFVGNPITRKINSVRVHRESSGYRLEKGPDLLSSTDPWFRPVALHFGPDGCLYIVDWYNKIIQHNEVDRNHPDRDKTRGRIWRLRHKSMPRREILDMTRVPKQMLIEHLKADITWEARAAWHQIVDRKAVGLMPELTQLVIDTASPLHQRLLALWSLEGLGRLDPALLQPLLEEESRVIRREVVRALWNQGTEERALLPALEGLLHERDPQVRAEVIHALDAFPEPSTNVIELLLRMVGPPLPGRLVPANFQDRSEPTLAGAAGERAFERSLIRAALEEHPHAMKRFLNSRAGKALPLENRLMACLALGGKDNSLQLIRGVQEINRAFSKEELAFVINYLDDSVVEKAFGDVLSESSSQKHILSTLLLLKGRKYSRKLLPLTAAAIRDLVRREPSGVHEDLLLRLASSLRIRKLEPDVVSCIKREGQSKERKLSALRALVSLGAQQDKLFQQLAKNSRPGGALQHEAVSALAESKSARAVRLLLDIWDTLLFSERKVAVVQLTRTQAGCRAFLNAVSDRNIALKTIDSFVLEQLETVLGADDRQVAALRTELSDLMWPVLRLDGHFEDYVDSDIDLDGPFTVEAWVKLDGEISDADGLLGVQNGPTFNFRQRKLSVSLGPGEEDVITADAVMEPERWTHVAVTRNGRGKFKIYIDGELNSSNGKVWQRPLKGLDIGRAASDRDGTAGFLAEFRVWDLERNEDEIWQSFQRTFRDEARPIHLLHYFSGTESWGELNGNAMIEYIQDFPSLMTGKEVRALREKFDTVSSHAAQSGNPTLGEEIFAEMCMACHVVGGKGFDMGPSLDGVGANDIESLLRAILTPNAGVEAGFRTLRVQTRNGDIFDGLYLGEDESIIVLRQQGREDLHIRRSNVRRRYFLNISPMPEGLLDGMQPQEVANLFAYLRTLK